MVRVLPGFARDIERGRATAGAGSAGRHQFQYRVARFRLCGAGRSRDYSREAPWSGSSASVWWPARRIGRAGSTPIPQAYRDTRVWFNPDLRSRNYFVPGVVVNIITLVTLLLTSMAIVREKEIGTMEQLMVTPIRPVELMLGKTLPFAVIGCSTSLWW